MYYHRLLLELSLLIGAFQDNLATNVLICIAAISNAVMDILKDKFQKSVFQNYNENFWNPSKSYLNKYIDRDDSKGRKYPSWLSGIMDSFSDVWHIAKLIMIICIIIGFCLTKTFSWQNLIYCWLIWGSTFWIFYNKIFIKKIK